jgi:gamma-glutamyltranspeptidase/glutathione hydrolase
MQDQTTLQLFLDHVEFGQMPKEAITSPRFRTYHMQNSFNPSPDANKRVFKIGAMEIDSTSQITIGNLKSRGHDVTAASELIGVPVMIYFNQKTGISYAAGEPRAPNGKFCAALNTSK